MTLVKVAVTSDFVFLDPQEIIKRLNKKTVGEGRACYDHAHHQFIVECELIDAEPLARDLLEIVKCYLQEEGPNAGLDDEKIEITSVVPIDNQEGGSISYDELWKLVDQFEQSAKVSSSQEQLIPRITEHKMMRYPDEHLNAIFSKAALAEVGAASDCDVSLEPMSKRIRIIGWSAPAVGMAFHLLDTLERNYDRSLCESSFDFLDDEGQIDIRLRLTKPSNVLDEALFQQGQSLLCELMAVEWISQSRHWRICRKDPSSIPDQPVHGLWDEVLYFHHNRESNNPANWERSERLSGYSGTYNDMSLQKVANTIQWTANVADGVFKRQTDAMENLQAGMTTLPTTRRYLRKDDSLVRNTSPRLSHRLGSYISGSAEDMRATMPQGPSKLDRPLLDFNRLQAPHQRQDITQGKTWEAIHLAHKSIMYKASMCHRSSLSFEVSIGHVYIYTLTVPNSELRPQKKMPAETFAASRWVELFKTASGDVGTSTLFSPKLTTNAADVLFLLNVRIGKGERLFNRIPKHRANWFEVECRDSSGCGAIVEIHERGQACFHGMSEKVGSINIHYPSRAWDCCWQVTTHKQNLSPEQEAIFSEFLDNVYVKHDADTKNPVLFSSTKLNIIAARLIRETVHRSNVKGIKLCIRRFEEMQIHRLPRDIFKICHHKNSDTIHSWWQAKLVAPFVQKALEENKSMGIGQASWNLDVGSEHLRLMLQIAAHLIARIDNVGFSPGTMQIGAHTEREDTKRSSEQ